METKEITNQNYKYLIQTPPGRDLPATLAPARALGVRAFHRQLTGYKTHTAGPVGASCAGLGL